MKTKDIEKRANATLKSTVASASAQNLPIYFRATLEKPMRNVDWTELSATAESIAETIDGIASWSIQLEGFDVGAQEMKENADKVFDIVNKSGKTIGEIQLDKPPEDVPRITKQDGEISKKTPINDNKMAGKKRKQETGLAPISPEREAAIAATNAVTQPPAPPEPEPPAPLVIVPLALGQRELFPGVNISATSLTFSVKPTLDVLAGTLHFFGNAENTSKWAIGDAISLASEHYSPEEIESACNAAGVNYKTLRNNVSTCRGVKPENRVETLTFTHHAEVCALDEIEQKEWLKKASEGKWSCAELRNAILASKAQPIAAVEIPQPAPNTPAPANATSEPQSTPAPEAPAAPAPESKAIEVEVIPPSPGAGTAPKPTPATIPVAWKADASVIVEDDKAQEAMSLVIEHLNWDKFASLPESRKLDWKKLAETFAEAVAAAKLSEVS